MNEDDVNKALWEYYKVVCDFASTVGAQKIRVFVSSIMCLALFLTFTGLLMTQKDEINFAFNLIAIGIVVIGFILSLFFILFLGYYLFLRIHTNNIFFAAMKIEELQRDILFSKISKEELQERFEEVYPFLNASKYEIKWERLFYPKR